MKTWFITSANRGIGAEIAKAALRRGDRVVATAVRKNAITWARDAVTDRLVVVDLDVTITDEARAAVATAVAAFGGIDVLVNNAGYGLYGFFEESSADDAYEQMATNLFGVLNVTWAVLPLMRRARKGHIFNFSVPDAATSMQLGSLYCASKFAVDGFSESLAEEVSSFGVGVTVVEVGPGTSEFLSPRATCDATHHIADYDERRAKLFAELKQQKAKLRGDPTKLADAIVVLADEPFPTPRFIAGSNAKTIGGEMLARSEPRSQSSLFV